MGLSLAFPCAPSPWVHVADDGLPSAGVDVDMAHLHLLLAPAAELGERFDLRCERTGELHS